jgi:hypothetical protein
MTFAVLMVPPFLKHASGPLLGPAMLAGAAAAAGHTAQVIDLNARWIAQDLGPARWTATPFVGDHDRDERLLRPTQERSHEVIRRVAHRLGVAADDLLALRVDHVTAALCAAHIVEAHGSWIAHQIRDVARPALVGVSVLYAGQVLWALAVTSIVRSMWPGVPVVWGGAHVTALAEEIARDARYAAAADGFVAGYAERTFVELLDAVGVDAPWPRGCFRAGTGLAPRALDDGRAVPLYEDVRLPRGAPLTLPAQCSRGCLYGKCGYCTYPAIEGDFRALDGSPAAAVVAEAVRRGARVSFKDSLLPTPLLRELAERIGGSVRWSACTKLTRKLDAAALRALAAGGCATLEFGLETLAEDAQRLIRKRQPTRLFLDTLDAAAAAGVAVVINYMTGFPGVDAAAERSGLDVLAREIEARPELVVKVEHNRFELERLAPLARDPPRGLHVSGSWPWSSVLAWTWVAAASPRRLEVVP